MNGKKMAALYWGIALFLVIAALLFWILVLRFVAYTDDAYVEGNQVFITPLIPGFVTSIHTDDTYLVEKGQLLIELDRTDYAISLDRAEKELAQTVREVCRLFHNVFSYKAEIEIKKAELIKTAQDYKHRADVLDAEAVSVEDFEHAIAAFRAAYYSLKWSETLYDSALALVQGTSIKNHPLVLASADRYRTAWVQYYRCSIRSPVTGLTAQRKIQVGMWVNPGEFLMSVIPLEQMWVNANFKETQLKHMRIGQEVEITSDLYGSDIVYHGRIAGLPGAAGNAFSILPPQNLTGNWIKIVQRLPVRVELDPEEIRKYPLRIGLSMEAKANLRERDGKLVPTSPCGSPVYQTMIYEQEEMGDCEAIYSIIDINLDPSLLCYAESPIFFEPPDTGSWTNVDLEELEKKLLSEKILFESKQNYENPTSLFYILRTFLYPLSSYL